MTSGPKIWPETTKTWSIKEDPLDSKKRIWLSTEGDTLWDVPDDKDIVTFEERTLPEEWSDLKELLQKLEGGSEKDWRVFRHGVATEEAKRFHEEDSGDEGAEKQQEGAEKLREAQGAEKQREENDVENQGLDTEPGCAMDVRPFETIDCADCKKQYDSDEVWWYKQQPYCPACYTSYFGTNEQEKETPPTTEINMMKTDQSSSTERRLSCRWCSSTEHRKVECQACGRDHPVLVGE